MPEGVNLKVNDDEAAITLEIGGKVDSYNCTYFEDKAKDLVNACLERKKNNPDAPVALYFDMSKLNFLCSSGIRVVVHTYKTTKPEEVVFYVTNPTEAVVKCLGLTNLKTLIKNYEDFC